MSNMETLAGMCNLPGDGAPFSLKPESRVLIAGGGGGYDFVCGLPIGLALKRVGCHVRFASYSFTKLKFVSNCEWLGESICEVTESSTIPDKGYFPEGAFAGWWSEEFNESCPVICFPQVGIKSLRAAYNVLIDKYSLDAIIVIDGGVDGIMRGDEYDLASPSMDSISIIAAAQSNVARKIFAFTAFGSEGLKGEVSHAQVLARVADLVRTRNMIGVTAFPANGKEGDCFVRAVDSIYQLAKKEHQSNIVSSIISAMSGRFGWTSVNSKTEERQIWVSPLSMLYWFFDLSAVARMKLYYEAVKESDSVQEVNAEIERLRGGSKLGTREQIPI